MSKSKGWLTAGFVFLVALVIACGGDDQAESGNGASVPAGGGGGDSIQTVNLERTAAALTELQSFRFTLVMKFEFATDLASDEGDELGGAISALLLGVLTDIKAEGAFIAPDRFEIMLTFGGEEISLVQIGSQSWVKFDGVWQEAPAGSQSFDLSGGVPIDVISDILPIEVLEVAEISQEVIGGISTTHYSFDKAALLTAGEAMGDTSGMSEVAEAQLDLWLTDDGVPIKIVMIASGKDEQGQDAAIEFELLLSDFNDDSIEIKPPA